MLYRLSYILNQKKAAAEQGTLLVLISQALLVSVLPTHFFALVNSHFMTFSFFSAGHGIR